MKIGINMNCYGGGLPIDEQLRLMKENGFEATFLGCEGASFDSSREKKSDVLTYALSQVGVESEDSLEGAILVGDTLFDVEGAAEVGVDCCAVTYGYGKREELERAGATYVFDSVSEVAKMLLG